MLLNGGATDSLKKEFEARKRYKEMAMAPYKKYVLDTWYQYPNYGSLNREYEPVTTISGDSVSLFGDYAPPTNRALPFVVKAFNSFRSTMLTRADNPNFNIPSYFGSLIPSKGHEDFESLYTAYITKIKNLMSDGLKLPTTFHVLNYLLENINTFPITQSGFLLSRHCPISTTGLTVELSELSYYLDSVKADVISTPTFKCFLQDARDHGFYVDKNNPWRLIANIDSDYMENLIQEYKPGIQTEYIMTRFFRKKTHFEDISCVYSFFNQSLTIEQLIEYTVIIRMAEIGMDKTYKNKITKEAMDIYTLYSQNYPSNPFKGTSSIIGKYCSEHLKKVYQKKEELNSFNKITLSEYM